MVFKNLEEKCKYYQHLYDYKLMPNGYIIAHLDGRSFSKMIKNKFNKPFDDNFINMMNSTALYLCNNVQDVKCAYVQSDEISLFIKNEPESDLLFGGRLCKLQSILASMATAEFNKQMLLNEIKTRTYGVGRFNGMIADDTLYSSKNCLEFIESMKFIQFDCKIWNVPTFNDAKAWFIFRFNDCVRNSKQQTAQTWCSHKELLGKDADEQIEYLKDNFNVDWNTFPEYQKYGRFFTKEVITLTKIVDNQEINFDRGKWVENCGLDIKNYFEDICLKEK